MNTINQYIAKAQSAYNQQSIDKYDNILREALREYPDHPMLLELQSKSLIVKKEYDSPFKLLDSLLQKQKLTHSGLDDLGVLLQMKGLFSEAAVAHKEALEQMPNNLGYAFNLAVSLDKKGSLESAKHIYDQIVQVVPENPRILINLGSIHLRQKTYDVSYNYFQKAYELGDRSLALMIGRANLAKLKSDKETAISLYEEALEYFPNHETALFMIASLKGEEIKRPPNDYIIGLFDSFAGHFDETLQKDLKYKAPELVFNALESYLPPEKDWDFLDLGAGTGLFGKLLAPYCKHTIAVDLSKNMLNKAKAQDIYDEYHVEEIVAYLKSQESNCFDCMTAVDVLVYIGDLGETFQEVSRTLKEGGYFSFTTELLDDEGNLFKLQDTARYSYSEAYIKQLLEMNNLSELVLENQVLRYNKSEPINGQVWLVTKSN